MYLIFGFLFLGFVFLIAGWNNTSSELLSFGTGILLSVVVFILVELKSNYQEQKQFEQTTRERLAAAERGEVVKIAVTSNLPTKWWYFWETI